MYVLLLGMIANDSVMFHLMDMDGDGRLGNEDVQGIIEGAIEIPSMLEVIC